MAKKETHKTAQSVPHPSPAESAFELIRWDKPTKWFVGICVVLFVIGVAGKFHTYNIPVWYQIFGENTKIKKEVIFGTPQTIRSDEWMMFTPLLLNQLENNRQMYNPSAGAEASTLALGLPVNKWSNYFKPPVLLSHLLDKQRAVSNMSLAKHFFYLVFFFLFLKLLTQNNFIISVFGTLFLYTSGIIQWWSVYTEFIYLLSIIFINVVYVLYSKSKIIVAVNAFFFTCFSYTYITFLYPPYQVPCTYVFLVCFVVFIIKNLHFDLLKYNLAFKLVSVLCALFFLTILVYDYYITVKSTYDLVLNTVYPGKREANSDNPDLSKLFSEYLFIHISPDNLPKTWGNISEASGSIMVFPLVFFHSIYNFINKKTVDLLTVSLSLLMIAFLIHFAIGFPDIVSKFTLLSFVPKYRITYGISVLNVILLITYLSSAKFTDSDMKIWVVILFSIAFLFLAIYYTNVITGYFFTFINFIISFLLFSVFFVALYYFRIRWVIVLCFVIVLGYNFGNLKANPLSVGIKPFTGNPLYSQIKNIRDNDKDAKWLVFGNFIFSAFAKSTGATVLSGVNYVPDFDRLNILDENKKFDSIYNRYAHISYLPYVSSTDTVFFQLLQSDAYHIYMSPSSPKIKQMGVKYVMFTYNPQPMELSRLELVSNTVLPIFKVAN